MLQYEMLNAQQFLFNNKIGLIIAFEGMDAAGKGADINQEVLHKEMLEYKFIELKARSYK